MFDLWYTERREKSQTENKEDYVAPIVTLSTLFLLGIGCRLYSRDEKLGEHVRKTREHDIPSYMRYPCNFTIIKARLISILY